MYITRDSVATVVPCPWALTDTVFVSVRLFPGFALSRSASRPLSSQHSLPFTPQNPSSHVMTLRVPSHHLIDCGDYDASSSEKSADLGGQARYELWRWAQVTLCDPLASWIATGLARSQVALDDSSERGV